MANQGDRVIADDDRWMIRGVDLAIRKVVKATAKAEGVTLGRWVLRALQVALDSAAGAPVTVDRLSKRVQVVEARLDVLEKSHRALHHLVLANRLTPSRYEDQNGPDGRARRNRTEAKSRS
jgi:hypothetical protein